jgi:positive regulator of sigma E activity
VEANIISALIAAAVVVSGWFVASELARRREDRTKRLQLTIEQAEKQVTEFYSPLVFLIKRLDAIYRIKTGMIDAVPAKNALIEEVAYKDYFLPTHQEISTILKTKIHLLEGSVIPSSLLAYIEHFTSENLALRLMQENIDVWSQVRRFPSEFFDQLQKDQALVYERYERALRELQHGSPG